MRSIVPRVLLVAMVSCGARQTADETVVVPGAPVPHVASASIEFRDVLVRGPADSTQAIGSPVEVRGGEPDLEALALALRSQWVREPASTEAGSRIEAADVTVERSGSQAWLRVAGDSHDSSVARCLAILRAAEHRLHNPAAEVGIASLREQALRVRAELASVQQSLRALPPHPATGAQEPVDGARARARELLRLGTNPDPHGPLPDDAPGTLRAAAAAYLETELAVAQLATRYGPGAIPLLEARERLRVLASQFEAQRSAEVGHAREMLAELDRMAASRQAGAGAHPVERARITVLLARLGGPFGDNPVVPDEAPLDLRILANEAARARVEERVLALRYGPRAPQMIVVQVRLETLLERLEERRRENVTLLQARRAELETASRPGRSRVEHRAAITGATTAASGGSTTRSATASAPDGRLLREQQLRETLFILVDRIDVEQSRVTAAPRPFRVLHACAVRDRTPATTSVSEPPALH